MAAIQGTRWGRGRAIRQAADALQVLQAVARAAVSATEQEYRKAPAPASEAAALARRQEKLDRAMGRFYQPLPPGHDVSAEEAQALIEAAVGEMNTGARGARDVDPQ